MGRDLPSDHNHESGCYSLEMTSNRNMSRLSQLTRWIPPGRVFLSILVGAVASNSAFTGDTILAPSSWPVITTCIWVVLVLGYGWEEFNTFQKSQVRSCSHGMLRALGRLGVGTPCKRPS